MGYPLLGHDALSFLYIIAFDFAEIPKFVWNFTSVFVRALLNIPVWFYHQSVVGLVE